MSRFEKIASRIAGGDLLDRRCVRVAVEVWEQGHKKHEDLREVFDTLCWAHEVENKDSEAKYDGVPISSYIENEWAKLRDLGLTQHQVNGFIGYPAQVAKRHVSKGDRGRYFEYALDEVAKRSGRHEATAAEDDFLPRRYVRVTLVDSETGKRKVMFLKDAVEHGRFLVGIEVDGQGGNIGSMVVGERKHFIEKSAIRLVEEYRMSKRYGELVKVAGLALRGLAGA